MKSYKLNLLHETHMVERGSSPPQACCGMQVCASVGHTQVHTHTHTHTHTQRERERERERERDTHFKNFK